jgi:hypothetical protein
MQRVFPAILAALVLGVMPGSGHAQEYFQQHVHYTMHVQLDTDSHHLTGTESIVYTNNSPDTLDTISLHLYPNAYRSKDSEFMRYYRRRYNFNLFNHPSAKRSQLDISDVRVDGQAVEPDVDDTVARIRLPRPLAPGATTTVELALDHKVREHLARAGYRGRHYDFAQWYPKVAVYDENGLHDAPWRAGEFYGEFGIFDVHITIPDNYVVAATGTVTSGDPGWTLNTPGADSSSRPDGTATKTVHFHAENVHDFAWSTDPDFVVESTEWNGIDIHSVYRRGHAGTWADSTLAHAVRAMKWLDAKVGPYPYPQVTVVDALLPGGMEYPMLVMDGKAEENLVFHEIGHIYFYGILANDEFAQAWLDEGFTNFQTRWHEELTYGPYGRKDDWNWYQHLTPQDTRWKALRDGVFSLQRRGYGERVSKPSDEFDNSYRQHVYNKSALMLRALRYIVGNDTFEQILHTYYDRWKLKHVNDDRFIAVAEEVSGRDLGVFFEEWLYTRKTCDYRLKRVAKRQSDGGWDVLVEIERQGEMIMPLEIHFTLEDGSVEKRRVEGRLRAIKETFRLPGKPVHTAINPDNEIADVDLADNNSDSTPDLQIDWPNNHYYPEHAYQLRWRPGAWYNDVDGLKAGLLLRGSYYGWSRRIRLGLYYGAESDRLDFTFAYDKPFRQFGTNVNFHLSSYKMEGRRDFTTELTFNRRTKLIVPPTQRFIVGLNYHELTNDRYLNSTEIYDTSRADVAPYVGYSIDPQFDFMATRLSSELRFGREWFSGKYQYERLTAEAILKTRRSVFPIFLNARAFLGLVGGEVPTQQKFGLAGGGPLEQERHYWLRAPGANWEDLNYHQPGHGNLRGYNAGTFGVNKLFTVNTEVGGRVPLLFLNRLVKPLAGTITAYGFYDFGRVLDSDNPIRSSARIQALADAGVLDEPLQDAGIGFVARRNFPFFDMTLRLDLPFWVSNPEINGEDEETQHRYIISLSSSF